ncbi:hypothetical protein GCM10009827_081550 [Dactylosporangium maewongense]|uniref:Bacterial transcriptional activator domain-containing protein n=1 Tax=Dactylosporangium maewongense TaxID=634393 RepID=A0ABN2BZU2_9ACTN
MNLRIDLFGGFRVYVEGRAVDPGMWTQRKPAALVKMLALAPGQRLRREQVTAALWPEFEPSAAAANLRKVLHSARRILHSVDGAEYIVSAGDLLFLPPGRLSVDVGDYWSLAAEARASRKVDAYAAAIAVYRQGLLPEDLYEEWAAAPREELHADFLALVGEYAGLLEAGGDLVEAARAVQRLVAADQLGEANHAWLMRLYALAGRRDEAQRQYARLCEVLQEELGVGPAAETQRLYEEIRAEQVSEPALTTDLWERVGDLRVQSGNPSAAVQAYAQALAAEPSGRVHRKAAGAWLMQHRPDEAEPHLAAADGFGPGPAEQGRLSCLRAQLAWERGDLAAAGRHAEEAHTAALAHGDEDDVAAALEALAFVSHLRGDWRPGLQHQIERLTGSALGQRVARFCDFNHCLSQYQLYGDDSTRDVDEYARETLALAERLDAVPAQAFAWCLLGESLLLRARWDEAAACLERSCDLYEPLGSRTVALPWLRRAELAACVGEHAEATVFLKRATTIATVTPMARHAWARLHATAAFAAVERGEPEAAVRSVRSARSAAARYGECPTCSALLNPVGAQAHVQAGAPEGAAELAAAAARFAGAFASSGWAAMADLAASYAAVAAGDPALARDRRQAAVAGFTRADHPFWVDRTRAEQAFQ